MTVQRTLVFLPSPGVTEAEGRPIDAALAGLHARAIVSRGADRVIDADDAQRAALERSGFFVKTLPPPNELRIGAVTLDIRRAPAFTAGEDVPAVAAPTWSHHIVHMVAPPNDAWKQALESAGLEVVEALGPYAVFVSGTPDELARAASLPFVAWTHTFAPAWRIAPSLRGRTGMVEFVLATVFPALAADDVAAKVQALGGQVTRRWNADEGPRPDMRVLVCKLPADKITELSQHPNVRWLEYKDPTYQLEDERSSQIVGEALDAVAPPNTGPVANYGATLAALGVTGAGVIAAVCDSGIDTNNNATLHLDLRGRFAFFDDQTGGSDTTDRVGHGTHVAGILAGNGATGDNDPQGFRLGQGVAPGAQVGSINGIDTTNGAGPASIATFAAVAVQRGASLMNCSFKLNNAGAVYSALDATIDGRLRDANPNAAGSQGLTVVFSAGNSGSNASTLTKQTKNAIVVGNSLNRRVGEGNASDDIRGVNASSSRGPAVDGRTLPTVIAPGTDIISARSSADSDPVTPGVQGPPLFPVYNDTAGTAHNNHARQTGTSMAAPHVTGACALITEWWRSRTGRDPSAALLKAFLVNSAEDCRGGPDGAGGVLTNIPNNIQGWGRVSVENALLQTPGSDRGPRIFSDQRHAFTAVGQRHTIRVVAATAGAPLRITIAWTDAPGAQGVSPALVNDLDLRVTELSTGNIFRGNVFANGFSVTGGAFDSLNNVECVYLQNPTGTYEVTVLASALGADARSPFSTTAPWQDFALVIENGRVPEASPVSVVPLIDRSGSMVSSGYVDRTRTATRQFIDLMGIDDRLGVVSFGSGSKVEFPPGGADTVAIAAGTQATADAAVNAIAFGGTTHMGEGLQQAVSLLAGDPGNRAVVMLSDGYDNGTPPVLTVLPAGLPVHTCAMGPLSDQTKLSQVASGTGGRYYYMPSIDDLFEIYNYIRGQVTGDGVIANESAMASSSRVEAWVDDLATEATFTVAWGDAGLRWTGKTPDGNEQIQVRLRDPAGKLLPYCDAMVRRIEGAGYVAFVVVDPRPGRWYMEVATARAAHTRYTASATVKSNLRLVLRVPRTLPRLAAFDISAQVFEGNRQLTDVRASTQVVRPVLGVRAALERFRAQLPAALAVDDAVPPQIAQLAALRASLLRAGQPDPLGHAVDALSMRVNTARSTEVLGPDVRVLSPGGILPRLQPALVSRLLGRFQSTREAGSYNVVTTASGTRSNGTRYVRKDLASVIVG